MLELFLRLIVKMVVKFGERTTELFPVMTFELGPVKMTSISEGFGDGEYQLQIFNWYPKLLPFRWKWHDIGKAFSYIYLIQVILRHPNPIWALKQYLMIRRMASQLNKRLREIPTELDEDEVDFYEIGIRLAETSDAD